LLIAIFLLAGSLGCIAWFNPKTVEARSIITQSKSTVGDNLPNTLNETNASEKLVALAAICSYDSIKNSLLADTSKHKKKAADEKDRDTTDDILQSAFMNSFPSDSVNKFFSSPEWKAQMELMQKQGEEMQKRFNSPEWKAQMEAMKKQGELMRKQFNSPQWKQQMLTMQKQGMEMAKKFNGPEWKLQMDTWEKQGDLMKKQFDSPEWKKQMQEMQKQSTEMAKKFNSPEWKLQMDTWKKQGDLMKKQFDSPEWKKQMQEMQKQGEEMSKKFNSPEWRKKMLDQYWILKDSVNGIQIYAPSKPMQKDSN
jgi:hypothetical protein